MKGAVASQQSAQAEHVVREVMGKMRVRIALLIVLLTMIIVGLTALNAYQISAASQDRSVVTTTNLISLVERQVYDTLSKIDVALQTAAIELDRELESTDHQTQARISDFLKRQQALLPEVDSYRAADEHGNVRYGEGVPTDETVSIASRDYFNYLKENSNAKVIVFGPIHAQISKQWSLGIARTLRDEEGVFRGVVVALVPVEVFQRKLNMLSLGEAGAVTIRMADMALVARATQSNKGIGIAYGSRTTSPQLVSAIAGSPDGGSYIAVTALDGIERVNAYMKVAAYPMYVILGIATQDVASEWRKQTIFVLILGFIGVFITGLGALSMARLRRQAVKVQLDDARRNAEMFENLAQHDALTGLPNRTLLEDRGEHAIAQHLRRNQLLAVALLDLDGFKAINDTYGHKAGDELLIELTQRMKTALRDGDTLARLGGDEFVALITDLDLTEDAKPVLERLRAACSKPVRLGSATAQVSVSIGVAFSPTQGTGLDLLLRKADQAMSCAKQSGRNQYKYFDEIT